MIKIRAVYYQYSFGHTIQWTSIRKEGRQQQKEEEEIGFETRLSMVKHAFWTERQASPKNMYQFSE